MNGPLDELRAKAKFVHVYGRLTHVLLVEDLDAFEAEHLCLRDFTMHCPNCARAYIPPGELVTYWWGRKGACSSVVLCPDCAAEAGV
jgi:hypothetical protein